MSKISLKGFIINGNTVLYDYDNLADKPSIPTVDDTLSIAGDAADAKATGDHITAIANETSVAIKETANLFPLSNVLNAYFTTGSITSTDNTRMVYIPCEASTTYTVKKTAGTRFTVGYTTTTPAVGVSVKSIDNTHYSASSITYTTGSDATYLVSWVYSKNTDSANITADEMLASVMIVKGSTAPSNYIPHYTAVDALAREDISFLQDRAWQLKQLPEGTDLNDVYSENGYYILALNSTYAHDPIGTGNYRFLQVFKSASSATYTIQIVIGAQSGAVYCRNRVSTTWSDWATMEDRVASLKEFCGANATRIYCDHGGFFLWGNSTLENRLYDNSPEAFKRARREGVMCQNMDIVFTSDGVPVVSHDESRTNINGVTFNIGQKTLAEVQAVPVGDSEYSWTLQTLEEAVDLAMDLGRTYTIDVKGEGYNPTGSVEAFPTYLINHGMHPLSLVTSNTTTFGKLAGAANIEKFPLGIVISASEENDSTAIRTKIDLIKNAKTTLGLETACLSVTYSAYAHTNPSNYWFTPYVEECMQAGLSLSCYTINTTNQINNPIPPYFDRIVSDRYNVPYERFIRAIST